MKKKLLALMMALMMAPGLVIGAAAAQPGASALYPSCVIEQENTAESVTVPVEIVNHTGVDIYALALSPASSDDWGENLLLEVLAADESGVTEITFTADTLVWDLLVEDAEGNQLSFMGIDFSEVDVEGAQLVLTATVDGEYVAMFAE